MLLNLAGDLDDSFSNGEGQRYVIYSQGCLHHCDGCQNQHTWPLKSNLEISIDDMIKIIKDKPLIDGVTFSGGDPLLQVEAFAELAERIKKETDLNIWCYTGYLYETLLESDDINIKKLLDNIDVLVDGKFEKDNMEDALLYTGSKNQRVIKLK